MYGFLNTANYAASFWTNAYGDGSVDGSDNNRIHKQTKETATGFVKIATTTIGWIGKMRQLGSVQL